MATEPVDTLIVDEFAQAKQEFKSLWIKVGLAGTQVLAILAFLAMHRFMLVVVAWLMPSEYVLVTKIVETVLAVGFVVVSLQLTYDMVVIFVPRLRIITGGRKGGGYVE